MLDDPYYTDSIIRPGCTHYRLRSGQSITGYMQINQNNAVYFSKDNYWWRGSPIEYSHKDRSTEMFDANRVMIFEHDLLRLKRSEDAAYTMRGLVAWDDKRQELVINFLEEGHTVPFGQRSPDSPFCEEFKVTGQLYPP